jgi:hypothetical protein
MRLEPGLCLSRRLAYLSWAGSGRVVIMRQFLKPPSHCLVLWSLTTGTRSETAKFDSFGIPLFVLSDSAFVSVSACPVQSVPIQPMPYPHCSFSGNITLTISSSSVNTKCVLSSPVSQHPHRICSRGKLTSIARYLSSPPASSPR